MMTTRRRGRGEGSIVQRADGRWMARVDLGWQAGRRRRKTIYGRTRRDVADKLTTALKEAQAGTLVTDGSQTVGQFLARWLDDVAQVRTRPRTWVTYEAAIRQHVAPYIGTVRLSRLTPQHVQAWLQVLDANGVSAGRRRYARVVLRAALNTARRWRLVNINAAALADPPRVAHREVVTLSIEQVQQLLAAADAYPLRAFVTVALSCGLRVGEALGLRWSDVDLEAGTLSVRQAVQRFGGDPAKRRALVVERRRLLAAARDVARGPQGQAPRREIADTLAKVRAEFAKVKTSLQFVEPKSPRSRRTIALPAITVVALRANRRAQLEARLLAGDGWKDSGLVFTTSIGTPIETSNLTKAFKALLRQAKLPDIRIHDLRHTAATLLLSQGVNPRVVMETLGHSQISLTLNTYSHVLPELQREAADKMGAVLGRGSGL